MCQSKRSRSLRVGVLGGKGTKRKTRAKVCLNNELPHSAKLRTDTNCAEFGHGPQQNLINRKINCAVTGHAKGSYACTTHQVKIRNYDLIIKLNLFQQLYCTHRVKKLRKNQLQYIQTHYCIATSSSSTQQNKLSLQKVKFTLILPEVNVVQESTQNQES